MTLWVSSRIASSVNWALYAVVNLERSSWPVCICAHHRSARAFTSSAAAEAAGALRDIGSDLAWIADAVVSEAAAMAAVRERFASQRARMAPG